MFITNKSLLVTESSRTEMVTKKCSRQNVLHDNVIFQSRDSIKKAGLKALVRFATALIISLFLWKCVSGDVFMSLLFCCIDDTSIRVFRFLSITFWEKQFLEVVVLQMFALFDGSLLLTLFIFHHTVFFNTLTLLQIVFFFKIDMLIGIATFIHHQSVNTFSSSSRWRG